MVCVVCRKYAGWMGGVKKVGAQSEERAANGESVCLSVERKCYRSFLLLYT